MERDHAKKQRSLTDYIEGIQSGNRFVLAQAITLIESTHADHQHLAQQLIQHCMGMAIPSTRIGITGTPGVGKSTFIEALGNVLITQNHRVAVLTIDPSSQRTRGSILGDKTRMERLSANERAFIRPSAAGDTLGGVARKTRETILLCEAAGFDTIIIETVGVGQSEIAVRSMVDCFVLLLLPGAGDELQGIKRGIVEMADVITVNKADGEKEKLAKQAQHFYKSALHYLPPTASGWQPKVLTSSALQDEKIIPVWQAIRQFITHIKNYTISENPAATFFEHQRNEQAKYWFYESMQQAIRQLFFDNEQVRVQLKEMEQAVVAHTVSPFAAAQEMVALFLKQQ
ncbi:MAG: methylmalonyl Co-A mutase-associated GTPase MeaB [Saprospiraceae bacterium]